MQCHNGINRTALIQCHGINRTAIIRCHYGINKIAVIMRCHNCIKGAALIQCHYSININMIGNVHALCITNLRTMIYFVVCDEMFIILFTFISNCRA